MAKTNRKNVERRCERLGASFHRRSTGCYAQWEDGTIAPWHIQWGTTRIPCATIETANDFLDRHEGVDR